MNDSLRCQSHSYSSFLGSLGTGFMNPLRQTCAGLVKHCGAAHWAGKPESTSTPHWTRESACSGGFTQHWCGRSPRLASGCIHACCCRVEIITKVHACRFQQVSDSRRGCREKVSVHVWDGNHKSAWLASSCIQLAPSCCASIHAAPNRYVSVLDI